MAASTSTVSIPVTFTTSTAYPLPPQKYFIPSIWKRFQLSQLINKALSLDQPVPFDFIVKNDGGKGWLRGTVGDLSQGGEETLELEYVESVLPPQRLSEIPQEEWVADVKLSKGTILSAFYDGTLKTFDYFQNVTSSTRVHDAPITSACFLPSESDGEYVVATASHDLTGRITRLRAGDGQNKGFEFVSSLHMHTAPLSSICSDTQGARLLTSSWDTFIGIWDTTVPAKDEVPVPQQVSEASRKRRKVDTSAQGKRKAPLGVLKSHTSRVSQVLWNGDESAVSCGFDSTVRSWDVDRGICTETITASEKPFLSLCIPPTTLTVLASSTDRTITLYDLRASTSSALLSFHATATPSCLTNSPHDNQIASGGYDGVVRIWDLRAGTGGGGEVSTFRVWAEKDQKKKILSLTWDKDSNVMAVGGEAGLSIWKMSKELQPLKG